MKKTIIKADTPGTFRLDHGQYPEPDAAIDLWLNTAKGRIRIRSVGRNLPANPAAYAWFYAPTPPPVDGFEAFCQEWYVCMHYSGCKDYRYNHFGGELLWQSSQLGTFPTLEAAQRAAYEHFLASLQDAP